MIGKVIPKKAFNPDSIQRLNDYILNENGHGKHGHKVMFAGAMGTICGLSMATFEMENLAVQNTRAKNPIMHCLLSWREGEAPSEEQTKEAVKIALEELTLTGHQCVWALHKNTDNYHVHISVNRIDPITFRAVNPANGWTIKAMERAARRIEYVQGWEKEINAWTTYDEDQVRPEAERVKTENAPACVPQKMQDAETRTGEKSAVRIAIERLRGKKYSSWTELHNDLAEMGMRYEQKRSGAVIIVGDVPIKASAAGKRWSIKYLEKSLGTFVESDKDVKMSVKEEHISEPLKRENDTPEWREFIAARENFRRTKREIKAQLAEKQDKDKAQLAEQHRAERDAAFKGKSFKGRRDVLNAMRAALAAKQEADRKELKQKHAEERQRFREIYGEFPSYEKWLRDHNKEAEAEEWREKARPKTPLFIVPGDGAEMKNVPTARDIRGFMCKEQPRGLLFASRHTGENAFMDSGKAIRVYVNDDAALLASLQVAAKKWGAVQLNGKTDFKLKCLALAVEHGIKITNPELQGELADILNKKKEAEKAALAAPNAVRHALNDFRRYHEAVGADRYRVIATQIGADGNKRGFMVNKRDGAPDGFAPQELAEKMPRLVSLEKREGRNIYYTPVSTDKHHILIDDLTSANLDKLIKDGYQPVAIIETSPNNWQAVITIPKLGTDIDCEIGNALVSRLNREYGDPKVSGEIHAHRAPGFENRKPKHRDQNGGYPEVKLVSAHRVECAKTSELAKQIYIDLKARAQKSERDLNCAAALLTPEERNAAPGAKSYEVHFKDVLRIMREANSESGKPIDMNRVDSMVCLRMRAVGHTQEAIRAAAELMAPRLRAAVGDTGTHIWPDYAARTVSYVFGYKGDMALERAKGYHEYWREVEKRAAPVKARPISERAARQMGLRQRRERDSGLDR